MYSLPRENFTGKRSVKPWYAVTTSSLWNIAYIVWLHFLFGLSGSGNISCSSCLISSSSFSFILCKCYHYWCIWPWTMGVLSGRCLLINVSVRPGHARKWLFLIAFTHVDCTGEKYAACRYLTKSYFVCCFRRITKILALLSCMLMRWYLSSRSHCCCCNSILQKFQLVILLTCVVGNLIC